MNKEKWQRELNQMQLSEIQKQRMKQQVIATKQMKKVDWTYRITVPTFIVLALFCMYLFLGEQMNTKLIHQATAPQNLEMDHSDYFRNLEVHFGITFCLLIANINLGYFVFMETKRWQQPRIMSLRKILKRTQKGSYVLLPIFILIVLNFLLLTNVLSVAVLKWCIVALLILLHFFIILFITRHSKMTIACPHCQHQFSKKERRKLMNTILKPMQCPNCKQVVYYTKKSRKLSGMTNIINLVMLFIIANVGLPFLYTFICIAVYGILGIRKLLPLLTELEEKEEFLW